MTMTDLAINKINKELAGMKGNSDQKVSAVKKHVADVLIEFCQQDTEFAQAVVQSSKTLGDCCREIMSGCGNSISDIAVYQKAVQFYFHGAGIKMTMTIDLCASVSDCNTTETKAEPAEQDGTEITLDLTSFL